jgi:LPXTG-site transpeptidase (sortase) family protein
VDGPAAVGSAVTSPSASPAAVPPVPEVAATPGPAVTALGPRSSGLPEDRRPAAVPPARLTIPVLGVFAAPVVEVGLGSSGELEVPPVTEVGWYRFGPHPGEPGSAVLAGHIAYGGVDGWFSRLDSVGPGDEVTVDHVDGGVSRWQVSSVERFDKDELPLDRVFSHHGEALLTLITCGGAFNPSLGSYDDNVVVFARRVA